MSPEQRVVVVIHDDWDIVYSSEQAEIDARYKGESNEDIHRPASTQSDWLWD